jgi:hypothetical protein
MHEHPRVHPEVDVCARRVDSAADEGAEGRAKGDGGERLV